MLINVLSKVNHFSLKTKLLLSFTIIVFSLVLVTIYVTQSVAVTHSKRILQENIRVSNVVVHEHVNDTAKVVHKAAPNLSSDFSLKSLILNATPDSASLHVAMNNFSSRFNTSDFAVLSAQGEIIVNSVGFSSLSIDKLDELKGEKGGWLYINDSFYLSVAVPVKNTPLSRNAMAYLVFAKPIERVFNQDLATLSNLNVAVYANLPNMPEQVVSSTLDLDFAQHVLKRRSMIENDLYTSSFEQVNYYGAIKTLAEQPSLQLYLMLFTEEEKVFLSYTALLKNVIVLLAIASIIALIFALVLSQTISSPLLKLSQVAQKIGEGEHSINIPCGNTKEVNRLADAIFQMNYKITKRNTEIQKLAFVDDLTELPNRTAFYEFVNQRLSESVKVPLALILIDIAKFTDINDAIGYQSADLLLNQIAQRLAKHFANKLMVIRMAGNQFAILIDNNKDIEKTVTEVTECLHSPFSIDDLRIAINQKIGCAHIDTNISDARSLAQAADIALKVAKGGYSSYVIFDESLNLYDSHKLALMSELGNITQNGQLTLHYQPQLCLEKNKVENVECLARWIHPEFGFVPPDVFIELAEHSGQIKAITRFVIMRAIKQHSHWRSLGYDIVMAVNISTIDLSDKHFSEFVHDTLIKHNVSADKLIIEVTESAAMEEPELALQCLSSLSEIGIKLSIDDFGTGYSSMAQLKKMPVNELKIDKAFVLNLAKDTEDQSIVATFIALAKNLNLATVAEGVEDQASLDLLKQMGCTYAQGYHISRPLSENAIIEWFKSDTNINLVAQQEVN